MRVFVTGGAGFIGSELAIREVKAGNKVTIIDDLSSGTVSNLDRITEEIGGQRIEALIWSVEDAEEIGLLQEIMSRVDRIYHLASVVGVQRYVTDPVGTIDGVIGPTQAILNHLEPRHRLVVTSTSEAYGRSGDLPMREDGESVFGWKSRWSYGMAKALDEILLRGYANDGMDIRIARLFNVVGLGQSMAYGNVMPLFVEQAKSGGPFVIHGDGEQTRSYCAVSDTVAALRLLMEADQCRGETINIGSDEEVTVNDLAGLVEQVVGETVERRHIPYSEVYGEGFEDIPRRCPDISKARHLLGWSPTRGIETPIRELVTGRYERE